MRNYFLLFAVILIFVSCKEAGETGREDGLLIRLHAEVGSKSRTVTDTDGSSSFLDGDCIGLFVPGAGYALEWSYDGSNWSTGSNATWENKEDDFDFYAFYPCSSDEIPADAVPMPDLSSQSGDFSDIGSKDFLVARCTTSYNDNEGVVSFSGSSSFKHVYSLLHLNIVSEDNSEEVMVTGCNFSGDGIARNGEYSFGNTASDDGIVWNGSSVGSVIEVNYKSPLAVSDGFDVAVLVNPVPLNVPLEFSLFYEKGGVPYVAEVGIPCEFTGGSYNRVKLNWVKDGLTIQENEIEDWNVVTVDDIPFQGAEL